MSVRFTDGPWRVFREGWRSNKTQIFIAADVPARGKLAHVFSLYADPGAEAEANAHLIAAAPDGYTAATQAIEHMEWSTPRGRAAYEGLVAFVAKAEGRQ